MKTHNTVQKAYQDGKKIVSLPKGERREGKAVQRLDARRKDYTMMMGAKPKSGYHKPGSMQ